MEEDLESDSIYCSRSYPLIYLNAKRKNGRRVVGFACGVSASVPTGSKAGETVLGRSW